MTMLDTDLTRRHCGGDVIGGRVSTAGLERELEIGALVVTAATRWGLLDLLDEITSSVQYLLDEQKDAARVSVRLLISTDHLRVDVGHEWMLVPLEAETVAA